MLTVSARRTLNGTIYFTFFYMDYQVKDIILFQDTLKVNVNG